MVKDVLVVFLIGEELLHLADILPHFAQVDWSEVLKETLISEVLYFGTPTLSILKKKALGTSLGGLTSAR